MSAEDFAHIAASTIRQVRWVVEFESVVLPLSAAVRSLLGGDGV